MTTVKWAILGTSYISEVLAEAIQHSDTGELIAIYSRSIDKANTFAKKFSCAKSYDNLEALLEDNEIDAIYNGLPNHLHEETTILSAKAGKHILCEKPLTHHTQSAINMIDCIQQTNVFCMEALMYRSHPLTEKIVSLLNNAVIGEVKHYQALYTADIASVANPTAGGAIRNLGCYPVSLIRLLAGEPLSLIGSGYTRDNNKEKDAQASLILTLPNNVQATVTTADNLPFSWLFAIYGSKGNLRVVTNPWLPNQTNNIIEIYGPENILKETITVTADKPLYSYQIDIMGECINNPNQRGKVGISLKDSLNNMKILDQWREQIT